jgi:hypothetical protein
LSLERVSNVFLIYYGFEIKKDFYKDAKEKVLRCGEPKLF